MLGLGVPVGLDDDRRGAHAGERCRVAPGSRPVVAAPPPVVAAPPPRSSPRSRPSSRDDEPLSSPHAARSRKPASGTASQAALVVLPCVLLVGVAMGRGLGSAAACGRSRATADDAVADEAEEPEDDEAEQRREDDRPEELLGLEARAVVVDQQPMPGSPWRKKKSPTMAPITDRPAEMRKPVKIAGMPAGNCSCQQARPAARRRAA